jgi:prepilin-type N-terminal cleavage/methylation domain-containing protein
MNRKSVNGFTLAELVVVIVILAILGTLAFVSYGRYITTTRDASRTSDLVVITRALAQQV